MGISDRPVKWFSWEAVERERGKTLPHYEQEDAIYFVTFRLWDSLPGDVYAELATRREQWLVDHPAPTPEEEEELEQVYSQPLERYLDEGHGSCLLRRSDLRDELLRIILHFDGERYEVGDYVVMPNHMHLLMRTLTGYRLKNVCYRWKNLSATAINRVMSRTGRLWQVEAFDHIVRSPEKLREYQEYIRGNRRGLREGEFTLGEGCLFRD